MGLNFGNITLRIMIVFLLGITTSISYSNELKIYPSNDIFIRGGSHYMSNFNQTSLLTKFSYNPVYQRYSVLSFRVPPSASITGASVNLYLNWLSETANGTPPYQLHVFYSETTDWDESSASWSTFLPTAESLFEEDKKIMTREVHPEDVGSYISFDITSYVETKTSSGGLITIYVGGDYTPDYGTADGSTFYFDSKESENPPYLAIEGLPEPYITSFPDTISITGTPYHYQVETSVPDGDFTFDIQPSVPDWLAVDEINGSISGTPDESDVGLLNIKVVSKKGDFTDEQSFTLNVIKYTPPTFINLYHSDTVKMNEPYSFQPLIEASLSGTFSMTSNQDISWLSCNPENGKISGTYDNEGVFIIRLGFEEPRGSVYDTLKIFVHKPPLLRPVDEISALVDVPQTFWLVSNKAGYFGQKSDWSWLDVNRFTGEVLITTENSGRFLAETYFTDNIDTVYQSFWITSIVKPYISDAPNDTTISLNEEFIYKITANKYGFFTLKSSNFINWLKIDPVANVLYGTPWEPGDYSYTLLFFDGTYYDSTDFSVKVVSPSALRSDDFQNYYSIHPNPASENIQIKTEDKFDEVILIDSNGKIVCRTVLKAGELLNIDALPGGIYFVQIVKQNMILTTKRLIIKR